MVALDEVELESTADVGGRLDGSLPCPHSGSATAPAVAEPEWTLARVRERSLQLLALREHSREELRRKLRQRGWPLELVEQVLDGHEQAGYLDDRRFATAYAQQRRQQGRGGERIRSELLSRGVPREVVDEVAGPCDSGEEAECEVEQACGLARTRLDRGRAPAQVARWLLSRGFRSSVVRRALELAGGPGGEFDDQDG